MFADIVEKVAEPYRSQVRLLMGQMKALRLQKGALLRHARATNTSREQLEGELGVIIFEGQQLLDRAHAVLQLPEAFPPGRRAYCAKHDALCRVWPDALQRHLSCKFPTVIDIDAEELSGQDPPIVLKSAGSMCIACTLSCLSAVLQG